MMPPSLDLACACHLWILRDLLVACCLSGKVFFSLTFFLLTYLSDDATCSWSGLRLSFLNLDRQLRSPGPDTLKQTNMHMKQLFHCYLHTRILLCSGGLVWVQTHEDHTRRTNEVPYIDAGGHFMRESTQLGAISNPKHHLDAAVPMRSAITALQITQELCRTRLQKCTWMKQPFHCDLRPWIQLYSVGRVWAQTREDRTRRTDKFPTSTPRATLCEQTPGFVQFQRPNITLTQQFHCDLQSLPCKPTRTMSNKAAKMHMNEAAIPLRSAPLNSTLHCRTGFWAQTREDRQGSPHRRHEPLGARKHKGSCDFQRPNITLTQQFPPPPAIGRHCHANHKRAASTKTADTNMKQPLQCDLHPWIQLYTVGQVFERKRAKTDKVPHIDATRPLGARKHKGSCDFQRPNITLTQQFHCDRPSLPCKSQKGCVNQDRRHKHEAAITVRSAPLNSTLHCRTGLSANAWRQTRFPTPTPGATWCENIGFRAMSKHHLAYSLTSLLSLHPYSLHISTFSKLSLKI